MKNNSKSKNGKIELLRFMFCIAILMFHLQKYFIGEASLKNGLHIALFPHGSIGVEFFFLVSGYLMANTIYKEKNNGNIAIDTFHFIKKKLCSIFSYHTIAFIITIISSLLILNYNFVEKIIYVISTLPNYFLIQMSGIYGCNPNHIEWYLSTMFIAMIILYPIIKKNYQMFVYVIGPTLCLLIFGYLSYTYNSLTGVSIWTGFCYKSLLRAIAEISLGVISFEIVQNLDKLKITKVSKLLLYLIEILSIVASTIFIIMTFSKKYEIYALFFITIVVITGFSKQLYNEKIFDNKICFFLGKISLPIYLSQVSAINFVKKFLVNYNTNIQIISTFALTIIISLIIIIIDKYIIKKIKIKNVLIEN